MLLLLITTTAFGATYTVDPSGSGDYTTIQAAINGASDGDTITVGAGTYAEAIDLGGKNLTISSSSGSGSTFETPSRMSKNADGCVICSSNSLRRAPLSHSARSFKRRTATPRACQARSKCCESSSQMMI